MVASFVAYIDESGDEGFVFEKGRGSSEWFVLSAVITRRELDLQTVKLVDAARERLGQDPKTPFHFRKLKHESRLPLADEIAKARLRVISVLIHKPSIHDQDNFKARFRLYFYATRYLFERISWCCRDNRLPEDVGDGSANIIFSNRGGMSYDELRNYIELLQKNPEVRVDWNVVKSDQIIAISHEKRMGLQIADAVASSFYYAVNPTHQGFTEDRYARILKPVVYNHQGIYRTYGVKFWPIEADAVVNARTQLAEFRRTYP